MSLGTIISIANISFVASIVFFFFSLSQLVSKEKLLSNYFLSVLYFSMGIQGLSLWLYLRESPVFDKYFLYSDSAFMFLIGASLYLFFLYTTSEIRITGKNVLLHALPFFVSLILIECLNLYLPSSDDKEALSVFIHIITASYLSLFIYLIFIFRLLLSFYKLKKETEIKALILIIGCCIIFAFILILSNTLWRELQFISALAFACIPVLFIIFLIRYPHYLDRAQKESQKIRYRNSHITGLNKQAVIGQLETLLEQEKVYRDRTLTVKTLSEKLGITLQQLSELLNSHYNSNFNSFINIYRVEYAKMILQTRPDGNILEIAFECGFNSKSTFNAAFKKLTGITPTEYKKQIFS